MTLEITVAVPNSVSTKLNPKIPINPQFIAPIITSIRAIVSITFIIKLFPFQKVYIIIKILYKNIYLFYFYLSYIIIMNKIFKFIL